jgi:hypothetical protein
MSARRAGPAPKEFHFQTCDIVRRLVRFPLPPMSSKLRCLIPCQLISCRRAWCEQPVCRSSNTTLPGAVVAVGPTPAKALIPAARTLPQSSDTYLAWEVAAHSAQSGDRGAKCRKSRTPQRPVNAAIKASRAAASTAAITASVSAAVTAPTSTPAAAAVSAADNSAPWRAANSR